MISFAVLVGGVGMLSEESLLKDLANTGTIKINDVRIHVIKCLRDKHSFFTTDVISNIRGSC